MINRVFGLHSSASQRTRLSDKTKILRIICSDHGQGISNGRIFVNNLLREWGFLAPMGHFRRASRQLSLLTMDAATRKARSRELLLDWNRTQAYMAHVGIYGFVYLNLKGREPHGVVTADQFENVRESLIKRFLEEKIPGTTEPLFKQVLKGERVYERKQELNLPDLILVPADGFYPRQKLTRGPGVRMTPHSIGGIHRSEGVYAFEGQGIPPTPGLGARARLADIAPTLLAALGQPVLSSMTGKPLLRLFNPPPPLRTTPEPRKGGEPPAKTDKPVYSKAEERAIEKRLADLGYLE
jgi:predicted AlkP superfamily phosphohydrolase/phosphomutase